MLELLAKAGLKRNKRASSIARGKAFREYSKAFREFSKAKIASNRRDRLLKQAKIVKKKGKLQLLDLDEEYDMEDV